MSLRGAASIALFGTFDVENYGDLLFPHLVSHKLCRPGDVLHAFSPLGASVPWTDAVEVQPVGCAAACQPDLCIVGGGNIVSAEPTPLPAYAELGPRLPFAYPSLWLGAALVAALCDSRLVWNAPGLPMEINRPWARQLAGMALAACDYVATRDEQSKAWLQAPRDVSVTPDVALGVSDLWPADDLRHHAREAFLARGVAPPERWIVFHFNQRYFQGGGERAASVAANIAAALDALPVFLAIGPCHGDDAFVRSISPHLPPSLAVDQPRSLKEVAGLIAHSVGYVGSSLHGLITALSYHRPALAVARTAMPKFRGFLDQVRMPRRLLQDWSQAEQSPALLGPLSRTEMAGIEQAHGKVELHWERVRTHLDEADPDARTARRRLLEEATRESPRFWQWQALSKVMQGDPLPCPICSRTAFVPGPEGRLSATGRAPLCVGCGSLEHHRAFRLIFEKLRAAAFARQSCLIFGRDASMPAAAWFSQHEASIPGHGGDLDVQRIQRPDAHYDVIVCNHVLSDVADYRAALRELARVTRPDGFTFLSFADPLSRKHTVDWGRPRAGGHYRIFGRDVEAALAVELPDQNVIAVTERDPITEANSMAYIVTRSSSTADALKRAVGSSFRLVQTARPLEQPAPGGTRDAEDDIPALAAALRGPTLPDIGQRLRAAVHRRPYEAGPRLLLGEWLVRSGRLDEASSCFQRSMRDFPGNPWPVARMLRLHLLRHELAEACDLYAGPLRFGPDNLRKDLLREIIETVDEAGRPAEILAKLALADGVSTPPT